MATVEKEEKRESFNKSGRKKAGEEERNLIKSVRFNKGELDTALKNATKANIEFSEFVRKLVLNPRIILKEKDSKVVLSAHAQILKIGININQIARALNNQYEPHSFAHISKQLDEITRGISSIYDEIRK